MSHPALERAAAISVEMLAGAERADTDAVLRLDAERLLLLQSFRLDVTHVATDERLLLNEISRLNDCAIGILEHQRRRKGRELDMATVGRRAVMAYGQTR